MGAEKEQNEEIEVTPEMIEAGLSLLYRYSAEADEVEILKEFFRRMYRAV